MYCAYRNVNPPWIKCQRMNLQNSGIRILLQTVKRGITAGLAKIVFGNHKKKIGWGRLAELDLLDYAFEKIILDYPEEFQHLDDFDELKYICRSRLQNK